jgi:hypothetical protein
MRAIIIGLCLFLGITGYVANQSKPAKSLQAMINASVGKKLVLSGGTYSTGNLTCTGNFTLETDGPVTWNIGGSAVGFDATKCPGLTIRGDLTIAGSARAYTGNGTGPSDAGQVGLKLYNASGITIEGKITVKNISGACLDAQAPAATWQTVAQIHGLSLANCYRGIWLHNGAEYMTFSNVNAFNNVIAIQVDSGNNTFANTKAVFNSIGVKICGSNNTFCNSTGNNAHGIFSNLESNHNTYNLVAVDVMLGETFIGAHLIGDQAGGGGSIIQIVNSKGINLVGGQIGSSVTVDSGSQLSLQSNLMRTDLGITVTGAGNINAKDNFTMSGMWAGNN